MVVNYFSQGSVLKYQVGFRAYATLTMYGVSCNQGGQEFVLYYTITILYYELSIAH